VRQSKRKEIFFYSFFSDPFLASATVLLVVVQMRQRRFPRVLKLCFQPRNKKMERFHSSKQKEIKVSMVTVSDPEQQIQRLLLCETKFSQNKTVSTMSDRARMRTK
jgi:hypothetical protein